MTRRAAWAVFLLFAAVLLVVAPAEASLPRSAGVTQVDAVALASLERPALGLASPTLEPSRFSLGEDLSVFDATNAQGPLGLCGLETSRCALTYARNNPVKYVDPDGRAVVPVLVPFKAGQQSQMRISYVDTRLEARLQGFLGGMRSAGGDPRFTFVFRTAAEQQEQVDGGAAVVNTDGTSPHMAGVAFDISFQNLGVSVDELRDIAGSSGFQQLSNPSLQAKDPWHFQATNLITRNAQTGKVDGAYKALIQENQFQRAVYETMRMRNPSGFEKLVRNPDAQLRALPMSRVY